MDWHTTNEDAMTSDLRPKWLNVTRSLQKAACKNNGIAIVSSRILVNNQGDPVTWTEPDLVKLGPLSSQDELIRLLAAQQSCANQTEEYKLAVVLEDKRIVINKGSNAGVVQTDWFMYIDNDRPCAILCVDEVCEKITMLRSVWVGKQTDALKIGDPFYKIYW